MTSAHRRAPTYENSHELENKAVRTSVSSKAVSIIVATLRAYQSVFFSNPASWRRRLHQGQNGLRCHHVAAGKGPDESYLRAAGAIVGKQGTVPYFCQ